MHDDVGDAQAQGLRRGDGGAAICNDLGGAHGSGWRVLAIQPADTAWLGVKKRGRERRSLSGSEGACLGGGVAILCESQKRENRF
jgi:hypothetical protein